MEQLDSLKSLDGEQEGMGWMFLRTWKSGQSDWLVTVQTLTMEVPPMGHGGWGANPCGTPGPDLLS